MHVGTGKKEDPFAHLRKKEAIPGGLTGADGRPMIKPKLTFMGFFERPDGKQAAMFYDSAENTTVFYDAGKQVHGVDILSATVREAKVRLPDGSETTLPIGQNIELAAEPAKVAPKKAVPAAIKPAAEAAAAKPGPGAQKAAQKAAQQKAAQQKAAQPKAAQKKAAQQKDKKN